MFLQAIGLPREMLIQAMGVLFTLSTAALAAALKGNGLLSAELGVASALALAPAALGMAFGQRIRQRLSEPVFRQLLFAALLVLGVYIIASAAHGRW